MQGRIEVEDKIERGVLDKLNNDPRCVQDWYYSLRAKGTTVKSCRDYLNKVEHFLEQIKETEPKNITVSDLSRYFADIQYKLDRNGLKTKTSPAYRKSVWFALNNFFEYQLETGAISKNYMNTVKPTHGNNETIKRKPMLTDEDFKDMLSNIPGELGTPIYKRNKAILLLYMTTGMRRDALCQINISDFNFKEKTLNVIDKGEKLHTYRINDNTMKSIYEWLNTRNSVANHPTEAMFLSYQGNRITGNAIYNMVTECSRKTFGKVISPHKLRSGLCSILYKQTGDIEFVRRAIGHSTVTTTQRYIITDGNERMVASQIMENLL